MAAHSCVGSPSVATTQQQSSTEPFLLYLLHEIWPRQLPSTATTEKCSVQPVCRDEQLVLPYMATTKVPPDLGRHSIDKKLRLELPEVVSQIPNPSIKS